MKGGDLEIETDVKSGIDLNGAHCRNIHRKSPLQDKKQIFLLMKKAANCNI